MQSIARDSEDSTDDEFFDAHGKISRPRSDGSAAAAHALTVPLTEDFSDNEEIFVKDITKWSSNDLMDKIETIEVDEAQGRTPWRGKNDQELTSHSLLMNVCTETLYQESGGEFAVLSNEGQQMEVHSPASSRSSLICVFNHRSVSRFPSPRCRTARPSGASSLPKFMSLFWSSTEGIFWTPVQVQQHRWGCGLTASWQTFTVAVLFVSRRRTEQQTGRREHPERGV